MITNRFLSLAAATLITSAQWTVFFYPSLHVDVSRLAAAAVVAHNADLRTRGAFLQGDSNLC